MISSMNKHGIYSKKQKKASRTMMLNKNGFKPREKGFVTPDFKNKGLLASIAAMMFGFKVRRKAS